MFRRVLVDSDIVLDLLLERQPFFPAAIRLFGAFQDGRLEGHVSSLALANIFYLLRKRLGGPQATLVLRKLRLITRVVAVDERIIDQALASAFTDFEDAIQHYAAVAEGLEAIITRNGRDYAASKIPVLSAEECLGPT